MSGTERRRWPVRRWLVAAAVLVAAAACSTGTGPDETGDRAVIRTESLLGRWAWVEASGGIAGWTRTPATDGYTQEVRFLEGGAAELYRDGARVRGTGFTIALGRAGGSFPDEPVVRYTESLLGGWDEQQVSLPHPDTLVLADGCCDGYTWTFARVRP